MALDFSGIVRGWRRTGREMFLELVKWWRGRKAAPRAGDYRRTRPQLRSRHLRHSKLFRTALLSLLRGKPKHAYEIMELRKGKEGCTAKSLYPVLQRLCDEGLVNVDADDAWRTYWLSAAGQAEFQRKTTSEARSCSSNQKTRLQERKALYLKAQVTRFAVYLTKVALDSLHSHADRRILKIREIVVRAKNEIEGLEKPS